MADFATAAGHWYTGKGEPAYTIVGKNGKERNTTLRDARELGLLPSVTTIIRCAAAPALEKWKRDQVLLAALTLPRNVGELETDWLRRVETDWQESSKKAAERGTRIHGAIEQHFRGVPPEADCWPFAKAAAAELADRCGEQQWLPERSFSFGGYGGKTDLHSTQWIVDVKTKDGVGRDVSLYDEHLMQLAAYRRGLGVMNARAGILFVDRETPKALLIEATPEQLAGALIMFDALLTYWQTKNNYFPLRLAA
jgi:hypothetical protein